MFDTVFNDQQLNNYYELSNYWVYVIALGLLALEAIRLLLKKALTWNIFGDAVANFITLYAFLGISYLSVATFYISGFYFVYEHASFIHLPTNPWTILACILLADIAYYWEHRMMHRTGIGWATHTVHHSSPYFNISVAYRFGPLDGILPFFFHLPLAVMGFNPLLIFLSESLVQLYQTLLHTEVVKKLPKPVEAIMNTPSHHRVHHGSNKQYHDKNYAGIFIIWDRLFGTFEEEKEKVIYGITNPINSVNPFTIFFHGLYRLGGKMIAAKSLRNKMGHFFLPPGWEPKEK
ncbi:MAG: sterol desaturase family protein [Gammaproteobacteria bacterium]|nr:sterol desaturase family protein [Gammaproteobacteria bacterium]